MNKYLPGSALGTTMVTKSVAQRREEERRVFNANLRECPGHQVLATWCPGQMGHADYQRPCRRPPCVTTSSAGSWQEQARRCSPKRCAGWSATGSSRVP